MSYATVTEATNRYGSDYIITSCDRDNDGTLDSTAFQLGLDDATDWMDSFLLGRYDLPLLSVPAVFKRYCIDVAVFFVSESAGTMTTEKRDRFTRAQEFLQMVAEGKRRLSTSGAAATGPNLTLTPTLTTARAARNDLSPGSRRWTRSAQDGSCCTSCGAARPCGCWP